MQHPMRPRWGVLLLVAAGACTPVAGNGSAGAPRPTPEPVEVVVEIPDVDGLWTGFLSVEGQGLNGTLDLEQDGEDLRAVFDAPDFGLVAEGRGTIDAEGAITLRLTYNLQCPGTAELTGRRSSDGTVFDGALTAADCTGSSEGSFTFRR